MTIRIAATVIAGICLLCGCRTAEEEDHLPQPLKKGSHTVELNGFNIHYEVHGKGAVLMTLPNSWGLSYQGLRELYRPLERYFTMVYFDPRGMGGSDRVRDEADMGMAAVRADFNALREHLGLDSVNVIGWSNGATNLVMLASEYPDRVKAAIFLHGAASWSKGDMQVFTERHPDLIKRWSEWNAGMSEIDIPVEEKDAAVKKFMVNEYFPLAWADKSSSAARLPVIFGDASFSWKHYVYSNEESSEFDFRNRLPLITCPSLVIFGARDIMPLSKAQEMAVGLPDCRYLIFEHSGHFASLEEEELFVKTVVDFLGQE